MKSNRTYNNNNYYCYSNPQHNAPETEQHILQPLNTLKKNIKRF